MVPEDIAVVWYVQYESSIILEHVGWAYSYSLDGNSSCFKCDGNTVKNSLENKIVERDSEGALKKNRGQ